MLTRSWEPAITAQAGNLRRGVELSWTTLNAANDTKAYEETAVLQFVGDSDRKSTLSAGRLLQHFSMRERRVVHVHGAHQGRPGQKN
jgi:hypothetical protein